MKRGFLGLIGLTLLPACSPNTGPTAGTLDLQLSTPYADDGAVLLTVSGGPVDSVEAAGSRVYLSRPDEATLLLIVAGDLHAGTIGRLHIPDTRQAPGYTVVVSQVAARSSYTQRDPSQYTIQLTP